MEKDHFKLSNVKTMHINAINLKFSSLNFTLQVQRGFVKVNRSFQPVAEMTQL